MKKFKLGQRVHVNKNVDELVVNAPGRVMRLLMRDKSAWIQLDARHPDPRVHPFAADDATRSLWLTAFPSECDEGGRELPRATLEDFGSDHWSTFAYIETVCVDHGGLVQKERMRCIHTRHPMHEHMGGDASRYPTRLKGDKELPNHDDWDCVDDLIAYGLLRSIGTEEAPRFALTEEGFRIASLLRMHHAHGGTNKTFVPRPAAIAVATSDIVSQDRAE